MKQYIHLFLHTHHLLTLLLYINIFLPAHISFVANVSTMQESTCYFEAKKDRDWVAAIEAEISALGKKNQSWEVVNLREGKKPISCK